MPTQTQMDADSFGTINTPEFLARLRQGGPETQKAFRLLVEGTHDRIFAFVRRSLSSPEECREIVQETYLAVHRALPKFEGKSKLTTWMYSLAHHKVCDRLADRDRKHVELNAAMEADLSTEAAEGWEGVTAWDAPPDRVLAHRSASQWIAEAVETLPPHFRDVYRLRDIEGLSGEDAAVVLGITPNHVRLQLHRARKHIVEWVLRKMGRGDIVDMAGEPSVPTEPKARTA